MFDIHPNLLPPGSDVIFSGRGSVFLSISNSVSFSHVTQNIFHIIWFTAFERSFMLWTVLSKIPGADDTVNIQTYGNDYS